MQQRGDVPLVAGNGPSGVYRQLIVQQEVAPGGWAHIRDVDHIDGTEYTVLLTGCGNYAWQVRAVDGANWASSRDHAYFQVQRFMAPPGRLA